LTGNDPGPKNTTGFGEIEPNKNGDIGSFEFVSDAEASPATMCREPERAFGISGRHAPGPVEFLPSELNKPGMSEQVACEDEIVVATWSPTGKRSYYSGTVPVEITPAEKQLELTEFDGHEALVMRGLNVPSTSFVFVIQRVATEDQPGIFIAFSDGSRTVPDTVREALGEHCDLPC
jgi:hypothetical protein